MCSFAVGIAHGAGRGTDGDSAHQSPPLRLVARGAGTGLERRRAMKALRRAGDGRRNCLRLPGPHHQHRGQHGNGPAHCAFSQPRRAGLLLHPAQPGLAATGLRAGLLVCDSATGGARVRSPRSRPRWQRHRRSESTRAPGLRTPTQPPLVHRRRRGHGHVVAPLGVVFFARHAAAGAAQVAWHGPWLSAVAASMCGLWCLPFYSFIEGCGQVRAVAAMRFRQAVAAAALAWTAMLLHHGLYSPALRDCGPGWRRPALSVYAPPVARLHAAASCRRACHRLEPRGVALPMAHRRQLDVHLLHRADLHPHGLRAARRGGSRADGHVAQHHRLHDRARAGVDLDQGHPLRRHDRTPGISSPRPLLRPHSAAIHGRLCSHRRRSGCGIGSASVRPRRVWPRAWSPSACLRCWCWARPANTSSRASPSLLRCFKREPFLFQSLTVAALTLLLGALLVPKLGNAGAALSYLAATGCAGLPVAALIFARTRRKYLAQTPTAVRTARIPTPAIAAQGESQ